LKIITWLIFLFVLNGLFSNPSPVELRPPPQQEEEIRTQYNEALSMYKMAEFLSAQQSFLDAVTLAEKTDEKEVLAFSLHYLGNIESWKSNFPQSILYHKKASVLFDEQENPEYVAISNNKIASGYEALSQKDYIFFIYKRRKQYETPIIIKLTEPFLH